MSLTSSANAHPSGPGWSRGELFVTTHWSVVLEAGTDTARGQDALGRLCQIYWYPVYGYLRRRGHEPADAQDLTQEFFTRLLQKNWLGRAEPGRGRFRSFLLGAVNHFVSDQRDKARAAKRGGGIPVLPLEFNTAETRYSLEPADARSPEQTYERRWALALLDGVLARLEEEYEAEGRVEIFNLLQPCLAGERTQETYAQLGRRLGVSEGTVKAAVHRLRQRYRGLLRAAVADTVVNPAEVDEELRYLRAVLSTG